MVTSCVLISRSLFSWLHITLLGLRELWFFQPINYGVVLLLFGLTSLGPGTHSLGLDNKCESTLSDVCWMLMSDSWCMSSVRSHCWLQCRPNDLCFASGTASKCIRRSSSNPIWPEEWLHENKWLWEHWIVISLYSCRMAELCIIGSYPTWLLLVTNHFCSCLYIVLFGISVCWLLRCTRSQLTCTVH